MSKKILLLFFALATASAAAFGELAIRVGADVEGRYRSKSPSHAWSTDPDNYVDMRPGFTLGAEYLNPLSTFLKVGAGVEFQFARPIHDSDSNSVYALPSFMPVYGLVRLPLQVEGFKLVPTGRIGFSVNFGNEVYKPSNTTLGVGAYWAAGLGFEISRDLFVEGVYSVNAGTQTVRNGSVSYTRDVQCSKIELSLGFNLNI